MLLYAKEYQPVWIVVRHIFPAIFTFWAFFGVSSDNTCVIAKDPVKLILFRPCDHRPQGGCPKSEGNEGKIEGNSWENVPHFHGVIHLLCVWICRKRWNSMLYPSERAQDRPHFLFQEPGHLPPKNYSQFRNNWRGEPMNGTDHFSGKRDPHPIINFGPHY